MFGVFHSSIRKRFQDRKTDNQGSKIMTNTFHRNRNFIFLPSLPIMMINKKAALV